MTTRPDKFDTQNAALLGCFAAAGVRVIAHEMIPNQYWPPHADYDAVRSPWFRVTTPMGYVVIGWRKRAIAIDWSESMIEKRGSAVVEQESNTHANRMCHAYGYAEATRCIARLGIVDGVVAENAAMRDQILSACEKLHCGGASMLLAIDILWEGLRNSDANHVRWVAEYTVAVELVRVMGRIIADGGPPSSKQMAEASKLYDEWLVAVAKRERPKLEPSEIEAFNHLEGEPMWLTLVRSCGRIASETGQFRIAGRILNALQMLGADRVDPYAALDPKIDGRLFMRCVCAHDHDGPHLFASTDMPTARGGIGEPRCATYARHQEKFEQECRVDLPRILDTIEEYLSPSSPISYGKLVEKLREIPGVGHWSYSEIYPRLFNCVAQPVEHGIIGDLAAPSAEPARDYLILDSRSPVGNCGSWWAPDGKGYVCNIDDAGRYTKEQAHSHRDTDIPVPLSLAMEFAVTHVRVDQLCDRINLWPGKLTAEERVAKAERDRAEWERKYGPNRDSAKDTDAP